VKIVSISTISDELTTLWSRALRDVETKRGGVALVTTLRGALSYDEWLCNAIASSSLWGASERDVLRGFCLLHGQVVAGIYVASEFRRQKIGTQLLRTVLSCETPPLDAFALPGDRAVKSLYESIGWKARLLTMRAE